MGLPANGNESGQEGLPENGPAKVEPDSAKGKKPSIPKDAAKRMHSKLQTLAKQGKPELQEAYKQRKSQKEKRDFFYGQYLLGPDVSERSVLKKDTGENVQIMENIDDWFIAEENCRHEWNQAKYGELCCIGSGFHQRVAGERP